MKMKVRVGRECGVAGTGCLFATRYRCQDQRSFPFGLHPRGVDTRNEQISTHFQAMLMFKMTDRVPEMSNEWPLLCLALGNKEGGVIQVVNTRLGDVGLDKTKKGRKWNDRAKRKAFGQCNGQKNGNTIASWNGCIE